MKSRQKFCIARLLMLDMLNLESFFLINYYVSIVKNAYFYVHF